jgi:methyl-accepting chemotaxis protein
MKLSLRNRVLLTVGAASLVCTLSAIIVSRVMIARQGKENLIEKSEAILSRLEVGRDYVAKMGTLETVVEETKKLFPNGEVSTEQKGKILKSVPVYAAFKLGEEGAEKDHYKFRVFTDAPRNPANKTTEWEQKIYSRFKADKNLAEVVENSEDGKNILVIKPVRVTHAEGCMTCHGAPSTSPWNNGKDILGTPMEDMKEGDLKGAFAIVSSLEPVWAETKEATNNILLWSGLFTILALISAYFLIKGPVDNLGGYSTSLFSASDELASASSQISSVSQSLSSSSNEAAASLEETVASIEELNSMVGKNTESAKEASALSQSCRQSAEKGELEMKELITAISEISTSSKKIEEIINVIDDIAFQTNLLALNAAVEAARAGEQGKGFAVVAEAVRSLAQRSANAAKDITTLIKDSVEKVERGSQIAGGSAEVLSEIVQKVKKVNEINGEIASASVEQSNGISQISKAMNQLDQATQQNAASSEESAASAEELSSQAISLQNLVKDLNGTISGSTESQLAPTKKISSTFKTTVNKSHQGEGPTLKKESKILKLKPRNVAAAIPFDDDEPAGKVGTTDGF